MNYDFHIHSCLSPCAQEDMTPANIAGMAYLAGLGAIAVTDHNSALNLPALQQTCAKYQIHLLYGLEVCTSEEIHVLCYFSHLDTVLSFEKQIMENAFKVQNQPLIYGTQWVMNYQDTLLHQVEHLLITGCGYSVYQVVDLCHQMEGSCWYAHIDKESFSVISVLGALPEDIPIDGVEIYNLDKRNNLIQMGYIQEDTPFISNSDAHMLEHIGEKENVLSSSHPLWRLLFPCAE